jgi:hypothetical protein
VNGVDEELLALRLEAVRLRMLAQRELIAERLGPAPGARAFPRSHTMRLLLRNPWWLARVLLAPRGARRLLGRSAGVAAAVLAATVILRANRSR